MAILITGVAGFIGYHTAEYYLKKGELVYGVDNLNDQYDPMIKRARLERLENHYTGFIFDQCDVTDLKTLNMLLNAYKGVDTIVHLAAKAGVRCDDWEAFHYNNVIGFLNVLACAQKRDLKLVYASSSSVYGHRILPFKETYSPMPRSHYALSKLQNEYNADIFYELYGFDSIGLRFFNVFGEYGRPDQVFIKILEHVKTGKPLAITQGGEQRRDFTPVLDVVQAIDKSRRTLEKNKAIGAMVYNVGTGKNFSINDAIAALAPEGNLKIEWQKEKHDADIAETRADITLAASQIGYAPQCDVIEELIKLRIAYLGA